MEDVPGSKARQVKDRCSSLPLADQRANTSTDENEMKQFGPSDLTEEKRRGCFLAVYFFCLHPLLSEESGHGVSHHLTAMSSGLLAEQRFKFWRKGSPEHAQMQDKP